MSSALIPLFVLLSFGQWAAELLVESRRRPGRVEYRSSLYLQTLAVVLVLALSLATSTGFTEPPRLLLVATGVPLFALGAWLRWKAKADLGPYYSPHIEVRARQPVIEHGLYAHLRHPAHLGLLLEGLAFPLALAAPWGLLAAVCGLLPITILRAALEDRVLSAHLPYGDYRARVPSLLPLKFPGRRTPLQASAAVPDAKE
ncbi:MAG TPA: isoprenylcysteine carboxylmethyltransferase family protein [Candidatus Binatia bacterium]|jgi:protein-S-isoprenylcysteine O-methyltransferase Ste14|nr:isoprenylcysteine carboxylmethyltransferase family protein [Candidatus Binatia bacterium]